MLSKANASSLPMHKAFLTSKGQQGLTVLLPHDETAAAPGVPTPAALTDFSKKRLCRAVKNGENQRPDSPKTLKTIGEFRPSLWKKVHKPAEKHHSLGKKEH